MRLASRRAARAGALLCALLAGGCLGSARPEFFALRSASGPAAGPPLASHPELGIAVGPLELPRYLDRPELVTQDPSHRLVVPDAHRWGGSLRTDILRVVADDLGRLLGTARVAVYPTEPRFQASYRVLLDIRELQGELGDSVVLLARWTIASMADGRALVVEESRFEEALASASYEDLVAGESAAFGALSRRIAEVIAGLPATL